MGVVAPGGKIKKFSPWAGPELSQATGMALVRCFMGKFLGVACHCIPLLFRCSHFSPPGASTSATTCEIQAAEVGTVGEKVYLHKPK